MSEEVRYIRFSILIGVPKSIDEEVVENDLRDLIEDKLVFGDEGGDITYGMVVSDIEVEDK